MFSLDEDAGCYQGSGIFPEMIATEISFESPLEPTHLRRKRFQPSVTVRIRRHTLGQQPRPYPESSGNAVRVPGDQIGTMLVSIEPVVYDILSEAPRAVSPLR
jgi:hypothetical protein